MPFLLFGILTLILGVYLLRQLGRASPARVAENLRMGGGLLAAAAALLVLLRGRVPLALGFGGLSLYLFTGESFSWSKFAQMAARRAQAKKTSRVRTAFLEMTLDLASGDVEGTVLAGTFMGAPLSALSREELDRLREECAARDPDSVLLLDNYLDRRFPGWRAASDGDAHAGRSQAGRGGEMTEEEAYQTLGLRSGAGAEEIVRAHRRLMKERHPDHGGTTDDAARLNQAKDRLMRRQG
ncbi:molecular chaperone DnaJ [Rhodoblastus sp. 17X3]|uniref:J domain-containing protein n=1 Tax=Rhodoblastus sp. 17X3 TaxID=3047026 RepID=UPI0024B7E3A2|nr:molecular chaperone DnaJ [Rhodoblastus sp. 17X3]MDI9847521.1 molecular chaperone DnaJ [Rhodoblastus sp. 17X3]